jgi:hypothetical protein
MRLRLQKLGSLVDRTTLLHGGVVVLVAIALSLPVLAVGIPPGYDADYHTAYQYHFSRQFWDGELYPRWLIGSNKGYGSPIFLIQYPLPYVSAALLRPLVTFPPDATREARELGVLCAMALAGAGLAARSWFRRRCTHFAATLAAVAYIALPYVLGQSLYLRTGLGELCALVWLPLALGICEGFSARLGSITWLGIVFALLLLTHATSAVLATPLLIGYATVSGRALQLTVPHCIAAVFLALALGVGLAAVYVMPLAAYRPLFDLQTMASVFPSFELGRWFAYVTSESVSRQFVVTAMVGVTAFGLGVAILVWRSTVSRVERMSMVALLGLGGLVMIPDLGPYVIRLSGLMVSAFDTAGDFPARMIFTSQLTLALGVLAYSLRLDVATRHDRCLLIAGCAAFALMLPWSAPVWRWSAFLENVQFPFRMGAVLSVAVAGLFAGAADSTSRRLDTARGRAALLLLGGAATIVVMAGVLAWRVPERFRHPETTRLAISHNVDNMFRSYVSPDLVTALATRLGTAPDSFETDLTAPDASVRGEVVRFESVGNLCVADVTAVKPRVLRVWARCEAEGQVQIGQLYWPLWTVRVIAGAADPPVLRASADGLMEVALLAGEQEFELIFDGGWPERAGMMVSIASVGSVISGSVWWAVRRRWRR